MARKIDTDGEINSVRLKEQGSAPSTPASGYGQLYVRSNGLFLKTDDGNDVGPFVTGSSSLLAITSYNPATQTTVNTTSTTGEDVDATNLTITFVAPPSGKVVVSLNAMAYQSNAGVGYLWVLRTTGGSNVAGTKGYSTGNTNPSRINHKVYITGLTPGASVTYRWGHLVQANTGSIRYGDDGSTVNQAGPATMEVWSAP